MDLPEFAWSQACICGRIFSVPQAYTYHSRSCRKTKKQLSDALARANKVWQAKKLRRIGESQAAESLSNQNVTVEMQPKDHLLIPVHLQALQETPVAEDCDDLGQSLAERRNRREHRQLPKRYRDMEPGPRAAPPSRLPSQYVQAEPDAAQSSQQQLPAPLIQSRKILKSACDEFGFFRRYYTTCLPQQETLQHTSSSNPSDASLLSPSANVYHPYPNISTFLLGEWYWNGGEQKSQSSFQNLLQIVGHPSFRPEDVSGQNWRLIDARLSGKCPDGSDDDNDSTDKEDGADWIQTPVKISVPFHSRMLHPGPKDFEAGILHHRKLTSVIREKVARASHRHFRFEPYELFWQPSGAAEPVRVYGELYTSEAFVEAHRILQDSPGEPGCELPRVVLGLMFSSDSTRLTTFSNAKLWPIYVVFGNESKDQRAVPCQGFEHIAYLETLPDAFKAFAAENIGGRGPNSTFMAYCQREMYHAQWGIILDDEFLSAYKHGIIITSCDGVCRRFYPRIFTYSADYPEKILIAGIRNLGRCPCPRCLVSLDRVPNMGTKKDMAQRVSYTRVDDLERRGCVRAARKMIYESNYKVDSQGLECLVGENSLVPATNAFSEKLTLLGLQMFDMLVVDLMHEVELGTWKAVFIHLLRLLDCCNESLKHEMDRRFREIPTFGTDGIRRVTTNRSELKKMTARDYEDMLQCAIPVFDGLLPEPHNAHVLRVLFDMAHWHGLAKLRMHTDMTLELFSHVTTSFGSTIRAFKKKTCDIYSTQELDRERAARLRRQEKGGAKIAPRKRGSSGKQPKELSLKTYKFHAMGDYVHTIRRFGTTDSYSTQSSEREHRTSKARFLRTNGRSIPQQLSGIERRQRRIRTIRHNMDGRPSHIELEVIANDPGALYDMGKSEKNAVHIPTFLRGNEGDPAIINFFSKLRQYLLPRVQAKHRLGAGSHLSVTPSENQSDFVFLKNDSIYRHDLIRFHFTTYDVRRETDIIRPGRSHCNVMLLADDVKGSPSLHHFLYARVLGAYHANVIYTGPGTQDHEPRRIDFLWVRWFEIVDPASSGWKTSALDLVRFPAMHQEASFGFVDPKNVLRGCHIIPAFAKGRRQENGVGISRCAKDGKDYHMYYVGRFSDRDLLMRYHWGLGVGHRYAHTSMSASSSCGVPDEPDVDQYVDLELGHNPPNVGDTGDASESDNSELGLENRDSEDWESEDSSSDLGHSTEHDSEDED